MPFWSPNFRNHLSQRINIAIKRDKEIISFDNKLESKIKFNENTTKMSKNRDL